MNIGIVTTWFERGAAYVSKAYYETLSKKHNVFIYARGGEEYGINDPNWNNYPVTWAENRSLKIDKIEFEEWIKRNQIEIILFNEQEHYWPPILWANKLGVKTVGYIDYYKKRMIKWFSIYDMLLCNTKRHYSVFSWHKNAKFIPWGTNIDLFLPQGKNASGKVVFFHSAGLGGINFRKGTDLLVKAFQNVKGPAELIIHAQIESEKFGNDISKLINSDKRITFINRTVPAPGLYHLGDVYVYPNRLDGVGLSVTEALSCGLPVICTDSPPCNENILNDYNGWLVSVSKKEKRKDNYYWPETICDLNDLASKMQYVVYNEGRINEWKINARNYAKEYLNWKTNARDLNDLFCNLYLDKPKKNNQFVKWDIKNYYSKPHSISLRIYRKLRHLLNMKILNIC